jgi:hypothetical protein
LRSASGDSSLVKDNYVGQNKGFDYANTGVVHKKYKPENKKEVHFLYNYRFNSTQDQIMKKHELPSIIDDVKYLNKQKNCEAFIDLAVMKKHILERLYNPDTSMIIFSGHGDKYSSKIIGAFGDDFSATDIDSSKISPNLRVVIFENCYQGDYSKLFNWKKALGPNVLVIGWKGNY